MKSLCWTLMIFSSMLHAAIPRVSWERDTSSGVDRFAVEQTSDSWRVEKTSNFFDQKVDLRLGKLVSLNPSEWAKVETELLVIVEQLKTADKNLQAVGRSYNDLNRPTSPHASFFKVGDWKIYEASSLYPRLEIVMARIQSLGMKLEEGVQLDQGRKHYVFYKQGEESSREDFNARFFCESSRFPTRCLARQWGALYLE